MLNGNLRGRVTQARLPLSPLALAGWLAAIFLAFGLFYLLGRLTAETRTTLRVAVPIETPPPARELTGLFRVEAIPRLGGRPGRVAAGSPVPIVGVDSPPRTGSAVARDGLVAPFAVHYRVRALASSVRIERVSLLGLPAGAAVEVRCIRACTVAERAVAPRGGVFRSKRLLGWLRTGAVVELRALKPGWIGAYIRVTVTGLPGGLAFDRACLPRTGPPRPIDCSPYLRR
jgi:hypothetical protein